MPLVELFKYASIVQQSMKEVEENMEDAKSQMNSGANRFRMKH